MKWLLVILVIFGDYLNVRKDWRGFIFWILADGSLCIVNLCDGDFAQASVFGLYAFFATWGILKWRKN